MADSSSDSDNFFRAQIGRWPPLRKASHNRAWNYGAEEVTEKIHTLASTLQDTNRNLRHVDHLLGQYREYNKEQTEAIATLKETLEQSIGQLKSQRLTRNSGMRSASLSSLYPSDLDGETVSGIHHFVPTSPLRDYGDSQGNRHRRSRSASVRFVNETDNLNQLHSFHQSLRDISSEQVRLGDDISRELSRRDRADAEMREALAALSEKLSESQKQETVSTRVERRLQEIEQEMRAERQLIERRQDQLGQMSVQLQEALKKQDAKAMETEELVKNKVVKYESEKKQLEQELEQSQKKLNQSESNREALLHQIEDLRSQLLRAEEDRADLQRQISSVVMHHQSSQDVREDERRIRTVAERYEREKQELEKHILELKAKLTHNTAMSEIEELKRHMEHKDKEKAQLVLHIEALTSDLENRKKQQQKMLDQLKEMQSCYKASENGRRQTELQTAELAHQVQESTKEAERYLTEFKHSETLRLETEKRREDLKVRAQEAIRQWKLKCKKLDREVEKQNEAISELMDKNNQVLKEKDDLRKQLLSAIHQVENLQKELDNVLTKRAQQEEQLHCKEMELVEQKSIVKTQSQQLEKIKIECDKLTKELTQCEEENTELRKKFEFVKQELEKKDKQISNEEDHLRRMDKARLQFKVQLHHLEMEKESILTTIGSEIDAACEIFSRDCMEKFKAISLAPTVLNDPHRWLAETKTKLQWLCEEVKERESKEKKLRRYLLQSQQHLKHFTQLKESEHQSLFKKIKKQEQLLEEVYRERRELREKLLRREEEMGALQERIMSLEKSTRVALDHLESVPEKLSLLEDFKDIGESHCKREMIEERYTKYKEIVTSLQQQLEGSKQRAQEFKDGCSSHVEMDAEISGIQVAASSSSWQTQNNFLSSSLLSDSSSHMQRIIPFDTNATKEDSVNAAISEMKLQAGRGKQ
ncbi:centrosomal protein of 128 kDa isoform X2 [Tympanuchus pallidicinctus]|uniref:centrosomal protein of 128 kDa isoform X2 n=1 Tax=Tympanuchus pallidicinctus TaxID=109042 RepID=UPI00228767B3|nr:centrosomal protein of 128 kDa isoform X2 [Tympanuchus pallidicinctus]